MDRQTPNLVQRAQEVAYDHRDSHWFFRKQLVVTSEAFDTFGSAIIYGLYRGLQEEAARHNGLNYAQVF